MEKVNTLAVAFWGLLLIVGCKGCYDNYQACYAAFTAVPAPTNEDQTAYCKAADVALKCLQDDAKDCAAGKAAPEMHTNFVRSMTNIQVSCQQANCGMQQQKCNELTIGAYNTVPKDGSKPSDTVLKKFCPDMTKGLKCFEDLIKDCPSMAGPIKQSTVNFEQFKTRYCKDFKDDVNSSSRIVVSSVLMLVMVALFSLW